MSTKELYAGTSTQSLAWSSQRRRSVDCVTAAGFSSAESPIGALLWKARDGLDARAYRDLQGALYLLFGQRYSSDVKAIRVALVNQALHEFLTPHCRMCHGTRELVVEELRVPCPECSGEHEATGLHRYSDSERARSMGISYAQTKRAAHKIHWTVNLLATEDRRLGVLMAERLR